MNYLNKLVIRGITVVTMIAITSFSTLAMAGAADVIEVKIEHVGDDRFRIDVTLQHADTGWDHYADRWDVLDENGDVLGERVLAHPHVDEQPFTRSLTVAIPESVTMITLRGHDSVHGLEGGKTMTVAVPDR